MLGEMIPIYILMPLQVRAGALHLLLPELICMGVGQAKEALKHSYFDDLDKESVDALESDIIRARED